MNIWINDRCGQSECLKKPDDRPNLSISHRVKLQVLLVKKIVKKY